LDGIPLALELAAARVQSLPLEQLANRLDDRIRLLTNGNRISLPRQQTLRALVDWSYNLLEVPEQVVLRRLAVFAGDWSIEAAEEICQGPYSRPDGKGKSCGWWLPSCQTPPSRKSWSSAAGRSKRTCALSLTNLK
jgi:hypothetical protein